MPKTARIDLSTSMIEIEETSEELLRDYIGGRGIGARLLYDLVGPQIDPLSPQNVMIFSTSPLSGTPWPTSSRLHVTFKSPATGAYGYANSGGFFVAELRRAGFDALIVSGKAPQPVYLKIVDEHISIEPARHLWGKTTGQVHDILLGENSKPSNGRVLCIGPAGENLVNIAAIINDRARAAARGGPGAVMGSKNFKAIHVQATARLEVSDELREAARPVALHLKEDPLLGGVRAEGTLILMDSKNAGGDQPARNHQVVQVPFIEEVNANAFDRYLLEHKGCHACPIRCGRKSRIESGKYALELEGPEYETTNALGPMCWVSDPEVILYANHQCNDFGLDTISAGVVVAFAMELHEKGLLDDEKLSLEWGDSETLLDLLEMMAYRKGIGDVLADGTRMAALKIGGEAMRYAMQVKGVELPRQEPRFAKGFGLGHATSNRGADHLYGMPAIDLAGAVDTAKRIFSPEIVRELLDPANEKYKPDMLIYGEHYCALTDALGLCKISTVEEYSLFPEDLVPGIQAVTGRQVSGDELLKIGERIVNLERMYNVREGLSRKDDYLPRRFTEEAAPLYEYVRNDESGEMERSEEPLRYGLIHDFDAMLDRYYKLRGWTQDGLPTPDTLLRLGLEECLNGVHGV